MLQKCQVRAIFNEFYTDNFFFFFFNQQSMKKK